MTIADKIEDHQARCQPHVLRLRMIAHDEAGTALTWQAVTEVIAATGAILAEAEAAESYARAAAGGGPGAATFLGVRLSRATAAANDAIAAAGEGDSGQLRRYRTGSRRRPRRSGRCSKPCPVRILVAIGSRRARRKPAIRLPGKGSAPLS